MRRSSRIKIVRYLLFGYFIFIDIKEYFKSSYYECRNTNEKEIDRNHKRKFNDPPKTLILKMVKNSICFSFYCEIKEIANYKGIGEYFEKDITIYFIVKFRRMS